MELPAVLMEAFDGEDEAVAWTLGLKEWMVKELSAWVMQPKSEASRKKRAEQMAERLMLTMEAQRELPGFVVKALNEAGAMKGWKALTERQRLMLLLAVYRPVGMEGRERQVQGLVDAALARMATECGQKAAGGRAEGRFGTVTPDARLAGRICINPL